MAITFAYILQNDEPAARQTSGNAGKDRLSSGSRRRTWHFPTKTHATASKDGTRFGGSPVSPFPARLEALRGWTDFSSVCTPYQLYLQFCAIGHLGARAKGPTNVEAGNKHYCLIASGGGQPP